MAGAPVFLAHRSSLEHDTGGGHPERPARITAIERELSARGWLGYERLESAAVDRTVLARVHPERYIESIERLAASGGAQLDPDTTVSEGSFDAALHAAGGAVQLVELLLSGAAPTGFSAHRPPGHHALAARAMGFCLFNNAAVAAQHALDGLGLDRVMIVDWDVHHGNGTDAIFQSSRSVLYLSIHQSPFYPGTGQASDVGSGQGAGYTVNLPVPAGSGDDVFTGLVEHLAVPLARTFAPQLILISAGFDAHRDDPLASCAVTEDGFATMASALRAAGDELGAPVGAVLEGGYALEPLGRSVAATLEALSAGGAAAGGGMGGAVDGLVAQARARLAPWWPGLA